MNGQESEHILKLTGQVGELKGKVEQMDKNISGKFGSLDTRIKDMDISIKKVIEDHEDRLSDVEDETNQMKGHTAGIAFTISILVGIGGFLLAFWKGLFK